MSNIRISDKQLKIKAAKAIKFNESEIDEALEVWKEDKYNIPETILNDSFSCDDNSYVSSDMHVEYNKIVLLNQIYHTYLTGDEIFFLSMYTSKNFELLNRNIEKGSEEAVAMIANGIKSNPNVQGRFCYAFATKYCSFAAPSEMKEEFPIYDNLVSYVYTNNRNAWEHSEKNSIPDNVFSSTGLRKEMISNKYLQYKNAVRQMQQALCKVRQLNVKKLDQYLWLQMKINYGIEKKKIK